MLSFFEKIISLIALLTFFGGVLYRLYQLNYVGIFLALILTVITYILLKKINKVKKILDFRFLISNFKKIQYLDILLLTFYFLLFSINLYILFQSTTTESIISPWEVVPWYFFLTFTLTTLLLVLIILKTKLLNIAYFPARNRYAHSVAGGLLLTSYFLLSVSVALIVYKLGFGFDPFIHQATENLIAQTGAVDPKPLYYLGQYALVVIVHKLTFIPITLIDKLLVPVLAAILMPYTVYQAARSLNADEKAALLVAVFTLALPFTIFTVTTPQNLAYLFTLLLILISFIHRKNATSTNFLSSHFLFIVRSFSEGLLLTSLALAALVTHPIAGIPAVLFVVMLLAQKYIKNKKLLFISYFLLLTFVVFALPLAFHFNTQTSEIITQTQAATTFKLSLPQLFLSGTGSIWLNFAYLYGFNISLIIFLFIVAGTLLRLRSQKITSYFFLLQPKADPPRADTSFYSPYLLTALALFVSYFITSYVDFSYLIDYERGNFAERILIVATLFASPFIITALATALKNILAQEPIVKYSLLCFFVFLLSGSLYLSYPRYDDYHNSRSFSTGHADIAAVRWIAQNARDDNFIVLANQQVSAAALREFGFKKYYQTNKGQLFYYPIPTGDALYQFYLKMVNEQANNPPQASQAGRARKTALEAAHLVGVDTVYFVINDYWFGFEKILAEAKYEADSVQSISEGKVFVFKFVK